MPRPVIKDIQIKKKPTQRPAEERPVFNSVSQSKPVEKPILRKEIKTIDETITESSFNENFTPKEKKIINSLNTKHNKKVKRIVLLTLLLVAVLFWILYFVTGVKITITPKITVKEINESITTSSWTDPVVTTVMSFNEEVVSSPDALDAAHTEIEEKIKNRFQYDTPQGYKILPGCKTSIYYENGPKIENEDKIKVIGKISALLIKEDTIYGYLVNSLNLKNSSIKDISKMTCEIKSDITNYSIGQKSNDLSFILSGSIKYESVIDAEAIKSQIKNTWKKETVLYLNSREDIMNYVLRIKPINSFPLIPKNTEHINIEIDSILD